MSDSFKTVFIANNLSDVFYHLNNVANLQIIGGATQVDELAEESLSIKNVPELKHIDKHETYIDFGPAVTLSQMLELEHNYLPQVLKDAIKSVGFYSVRNMATLGGNICAKDFKHTLWAPLLALNAYLEFKREKNLKQTNNFKFIKQKDTKLIPFDSFTEIPPKYVLTNIRVSLQDWDVSIFKRLGPSNKITNLSASFVFLVNTQKNIITNFKLVFSGPIVFHSRELENRLISAKLPLEKEVVVKFVEDAERIYDKEFSLDYVSPILKLEFLNLLRNSLEELR